jgi:hypothetical protein
MRVPRAVATMLESTAISTLTWTASCTSGEAKGCNQLSSVKPCHVKLNLPRGWLKEKATTTAIGSSR